MDGAGSLTFMEHPCPEFPWERLLQAWGTQTVPPSEGAARWGCVCPWEQPHPAALTASFAKPAFWNSAILSTIG